MFVILFLPVACYAPVASALWGAYIGVRPPAALRSSARIIVLVVFPFLVAALAGFWLHLVPCLWWSCDWGENDGQMTRGVIWGGSTALLALIGWLLAVRRYRRELGEVDALNAYPGVVTRTLDC